MMHTHRLPQDAVAAGPSSPALQDCHGAAPAVHSAREAERREHLFVVIVGGLS